MARTRSRGKGQECSKNGQEQEPGQVQEQEQEQVQDQEQEREHGQEQEMVQEQEILLPLNNCYSVMVFELFCFVCKSGNKEKRRRRAGTRIGCGGSYDVILLEFTVCLLKYF